MNILSLLSSLPGAIAQGLIWGIMEIGLFITYKVLEITDKIVNENKLTTLMITHNMRDAIKHGNRLIMMHEGHIIVDVSGEEKKNLTVEDLLNMFTKASGNEFASDRAVLSK